VRLLLALLGIPYERRTMDVVDRSNRPEVLGGLNPSLRVPTLVLDDGRPLAESNAILWYLGDGTAFVPGDGYERAQVLQWQFFEQYEHELVADALGRLAEVPGVTLYGPPAERRAGIVSFNVEGVHPHDVAQILDLDGVAIRAGHHCCQPLMHRLGVAATNRASFYLYTIPEEIDRLVAGLHKVRKVFG
jgi:selenocysteine lyase/cysteine desulfurase